MNFPGTGYTTGGGYPPQQPGGYPPSQQQQPYPPPQYPPSPYNYPPSPYNYPPQQQQPQSMGYPPTMQGYPPPPIQQGYPHIPQQGYQQPPPLPNRQSYPPPSSPAPPPPPPRNVPQQYPPPPRQDPMFSPHDPTVAQANYPQPPYSNHNQSPNPVPYGQQQNNINANEFVMHVDPKVRNMPPPNFQLSNCQGRKRALLIGINYFGTSNELKGCINDVHNIKAFLVQLYNFREADMVILTDDQADPRHVPTKRNIIEAMQWLVRDSRPNDSGHGGRMKDYDGDEDDGYDETIYPVDHSSYGQIVDDMMNDIMVRPLAPGSRLTAIFDSCHSGTALDLPYVYSTQGAIKESSFFKDAGNNLKSAGLAYVSGDPSRAISSVMSLGSRLLNGGFGQSEEKKAFIRQQKGSPADVIMFSGCKDDQTSADASEAGRATGAMSWAITTALRQNKNQSYLQLLNNIRQLLKQKYQQRPQLSSSHPMDMNLLFII
ncbi:hypothetical protein INT46_002366 [Mucor plumbeus]|uniref:Peptidase C14 caspase domain-containing protein n=1 Tax=Mucor plumbeus TaxID=97098 RepID=A0A8H7QZC4_9FUNG|nr:hypothetical protein INT46_002366 [Mucor plumbeus]